MVRGLDGVPENTPESTPENTPESTLDNRLVSSLPEAQEVDLEGALRPKTLDEFVGQNQVADNLRVYIEAARGRGEALDHTLLSGPPGLGKTTLAHIIARSLGSELCATSGPAIERAGDLAGILTNLGRGDVLFIDEIHRLSTVVEEYLYIAMEDYAIDIIIDRGPSSRSIRLDLEPFTMVGATTREGLLSAPMRSRFAIHEKLELYDVEALEQIALRSARLLDVALEVPAAALIAARSRGTPRLTNRILRRVRDVAQVEGNGEIDLPAAKLGLSRLGIDRWGLDGTDRKILEGLVLHGGGPVGVKTLALMVGESEQTVEEVYEPYLIRQGYLCKTPRGRELGQQAIELGLGLSGKQGSLFR